MIKWEFGALLVVALGAIFAAVSGFFAVDLSRLAATNVGTLFLTIVFTALVIERAVEVYVNGEYDRNIAEKGQPISNNIRLAEFYQNALNAELARAPNEDQDAVDAIRAKLTSAQDAIVTAQSETVRGGETLRDTITKEIADKTAAARRLALALSILATIAGVRVLEQFLTRAGNTALPDFTGWSETQILVFRIVDCVLTSLLLAGGADGVHNLVKDFLGKRKELTSS